MRIILALNNAHSNSDISSIWIYLWWAHKQRDNVFNGSQVMSFWKAADCSGRCCQMKCGQCLEWTMKVLQSERLDQDGTAHYLCTNISRRTCCNKTGDNDTAQQLPHIVNITDFLFSWLDVCIWNGWPSYSGIGQTMAQKCCPAVAGCSYPHTVMPAPNNYSLDKILHFACVYSSTL